MVWFTFLNEDCGEGWLWLPSYSVFLLDSKNIGKSFVWWFISLLWYMEYLLHFLSIFV
jgi:hypothetical protein